MLRNGRQSPDAKRLKGRVQGRWGGKGVLYEIGVCRIIRVLSFPGSSKEHTGQTGRLGVHGMGWGKEHWRMSQGI